MSQTFKPTLISDCFHLPGECGKCLPKRNAMSDYGNYILYVSYTLFYFMLFLICYQRPLNVVLLFCLRHLAIMSCKIVVDGYLLIMWRFSYYLLRVLYRLSVCRSCVLISMLNTAGVVDFPQLAPSRWVTIVNITALITTHICMAVQLWPCTFILMLSISNWKEKKRANDQLVWIQFH